MAVKRYKTAAAHTGYQAVRSRRTGGPAADTVTVYADGNTLRQMAAQPLRRREEEPAVSREVQSNRERSLQMNLGYVAFLAIAAVLTVAICVNYLRLQATCTSLQKEAISLENTLSRLKLDNDEEYNRIISGVNLEEVKEKAMTRMGMVYAKEDQIVEYEPATGDYVKQYQDVPD